MSEHVMEQVSSLGLEPMSKAAPVETTVRYNARSILQAFASVKDNTQTRLIVKLALDAMSCQEYDMIEKEAAKMADEIDKASGHVSTTEKRYGPKRNSLNTQASERRQVFGAVKHGGLEVLVPNMPDNGTVNFDVLPPWATARGMSREYLKGKGIDWQGKASEDKRREREQKHDSKAWQQARDMAEQQNPQEPGETYAMWQTRILQAAQDIRAELDDKERADVLRKKAQSLFNEYGTMGSIELAEMLLSLANPKAESAPF